MHGNNFCHLGFDFHQHVTANTLVSAVRSDLWSHGANNRQHRGR